ncbi:MAG: SRPBCC family protein [bacterium]
MKVLKILAVIILILVAAYLIVPLFLSDNVVIRAEENMDAKPEVVFRQVNSLKNWVNWSPFEADTTLKNKFSGPDRGVGCKREWDGEQAGQGTMEIMKSEPYTYIQNKISFAPGQGGGNGSWNFEPNPEGVHVTWSIHLQDLSYPHARWMGLMMQSVLAPMMEKGLNDLRQLTEKMPQPPDVKIIEVETIPSLVVPDSTTIDGMMEMFERDYNKLMTYVMKKIYRLQVSILPFIITGIRKATQG